jgi:hypothetical protein
MKEGLIRRHLTFEPLSGLTFGPEDLHMAARSGAARSSSARSTLATASIHGVF